jgi:hypothetical protein
VASRERLKQWVKEKRESGISDERIKKSLEETGHDPSLVDEVDDPFSDQDSVELEGGLDTDFDMKEGAQPRKEADEGSENRDLHDRFRERGSRSDEQAVDLSGGAERPGRGNGERSEEEDPRESGRSTTESREPGSDQPGPEPSPGKSSEIESPSREPPGPEEGSALDIPDVERDKLVRAGAAVLVLVLLAGGAAVLEPWNLVPAGERSGTSTDGSAPVSADRQPGSSGQRCDVGIRLNSISQRSESTFVEAAVTRGRANVSVELYSQDRLVGERSAVLSGATTFEFSGTGNHAEMQAVGCGISDTLTVG